MADGTFPLFQRDAGKKIQYAARKLWPRKRRRITLYSTRHQSMANGKAAGRVYAQVPEEEVARVRQVSKDWTPPDRTRTQTAGNTSGDRG